MRKPNLPCRYCGEPMWSGKTSQVEGIAAHQRCRRAQRVVISLISMCRACGCEYERSTPRLNSYCPPCSRSSWVDRECVGCGQSVVMRRAAKFCKTCRPKRVEPSKEMVHVGRMPHRSETWQPVEIKTARCRVSGCCLWCGLPFVSQQVSTRFCSDACRATRDRQAGRKFKVSPRLRLGIYERDDWTCQLCMEPVDRGAHHLDDWAPSLDHIACQSWTLVPDHSEGNLRTAHRWCNAVRGDERYYTAADLAA